MSSPVDKCLIGLWVISHVDGLHSNAPITAYAASISQPVITVNIGYRLNWFRSLVFQDVLEEYTAAPTGMNGPFNLAIQDQRTAFTWIDEFISGFSGDTSSVTAVTESAGSIFFTYHICDSSTRLFDGAILQSGLIFGDLPSAVKERGVSGSAQTLQNRWRHCSREIRGSSADWWWGIGPIPWGAFVSIRRGNPWCCYGRLTVYKRHTNSDEPDESGPHLRVAERCNDWRQLLGRSSLLPAVSQLLSIHTDPSCEKAIPCPGGRRIAHSIQPSVSWIN